MTTFHKSVVDFDASNESSLRMSMLQDESNPAADDTTDSKDRYGSIPQLEASPRRYNRLKDQNEFSYDTSGPNLSVPISSNRFQAADTHPETPPKLPEKPSRRSNQSSPPPLPPKKPSSKLIGITSFNKPEPSMETIAPQPDVVCGHGHDIYDFPPMPMLGSLKMDKEEAKQCMQDILKSDNVNVQSEDKFSNVVSVEELSRMSLLELNTKVLSGQLPEEMKGMSILELVEFINEEMKKKQEQPDKVVVAATIKPSFSDNFVCDNLPKGNIDELDSQDPAAADPVSPGPLSASSKEVGFAFPSQNNPEPRAGSGFDDDFTPFSIHSHLESIGRPASQATSDHSVLSQSKNESGYDKYAVFRELQMEEELIKAWKTPSDEEKDEAKEENLEEEYHNQPVCSSEGSPCSRSDTQSPMKSDEQNEEDEEEPGEMGEEQNEVDHNIDDPEDSEFDAQAAMAVHKKRESQVPIFQQNADEDEESVTQSIRSDANVRDETCNNNHEPDNEEMACHNSEEFFTNTFDTESKATKSWTTFDDDDPDPDPHQFDTGINNRHPDSSYFSAANKENCAFQDNFGDPVDWDSAIGMQESDPKSSRMTRQLSSESQNSISKCKRFSHRHVDAHDHICTRGHSLEASEAPPEPATYTDWWPPSAEGAPIKVSNNEGRKKHVSAASNNEAYSATPPNAWNEDAFAEPLEAKFKVFSKVVHTNPNGLDRSLTPHSNDPISDSDSGIMPKSDSVNIFSIKDDPFDDDFFH